MPRRRLSSPRPGSAAPRRPRPELCPGPTSWEPPRSDGSTTPRAPSAMGLSAAARSRAPRLRSGSGWFRRGWVDPVERARCGSGSLDRVPGRSARAEPPSARGTGSCLADAG
ncbi:hypothetical protein NFA_38420 [Nocardia farcinica IFM 10152]|uniref:Uncharacterized protein n=1 Tax=Nocardia farcinica (strain IFM 10152) TaxID=247156 RepID=Q5YT01_NOCFA|nr:hypothetical protein NFA_38420 [Nocardia farcinica IFM 10152]